MTAPYLTCYVYVYDVCMYTMCVCVIRTCIYTRYVMLCDTDEDDATIWVIGFSMNLGYFHNSSILPKVVILAD